MTTSVGILASRPQAWLILVRPSRRPLCGLLRMRSFLNSIKSLPHPEERPAGASRRTHDRSPAAEAGDGEDDDQEGDRDDRDADRAPQGRGQDGDAEISRFGKPDYRAGADRRLIVAGDRAFR